MAEANLGLTGSLARPDSSEDGFSAGVLVGVGGRFAGSLPRYYFMFEYLTAGYLRLHEQNLRSLELERRLHEVGLVGRVVLPLVPQLRLFGDAGVVAVHSRTAIEGPHVPVAESSELDFGLRFAVGAQYRPVEAMSVGLRFSMTTTFDGFDTQVAPGWLTGFESELGHREASVQLTFYF
jgi:opacity protein-like surface antigen